MVNDAQAHKEEDQKRKEAVEARNNADSLAHQTQKSLNELGEKIATEDRAKIESALNDLKEVLKDESASKEQIETKVKALNEASHKLAEAMYKNENKNEKDENKKKDDDVIDAEVE